ncbi:unnamed protein product [Heligmosomoides polygyrus]|uniref:Reverse transcriptase domain-containing protein n=1 Tax=Heligmosomoides polygyrus TaxID=6339 RepID=A0A183GQ36_HELPZ|nr:unnamed protein product [Heligmosomoides polygyrus]
MKIVVAAKERLYHFFSAYAPQSGCSDQAKEDFGAADERTAEVPSKNVIIVAGDLSGSQIDFLLVKDRDRSIVTDAKVVPYETVAPHHRPLICTFKITSPRMKQHVFLGDRTADNWHEYQKAKKACKAVAVAKVTHYGDVYRTIESRDGERYLYRLAETPHRQTEEIEKFFGINDESGHLLTDRKKALERWRDYFEKISTTDLPHPAIPSVASVHGPVHKITVEEAEAALKNMKPGKTTGPDDLADDVWKSKLWYPAEWLAEFFNRVVKEKKLSHSMTIFERVFDRRICEIVKLSDNQCGFVSGCGTIDAIHAARLLVKKHREKQKLVHIAFLDLEKAFARSAWDLNGVWMHQGSTVSPLLFVVVMDAITRDLQQPVPWTLLYADDVILACDDKGDIERQVRGGDVRSSTWCYWKLPVFASRAEHGH